MSASSSIMRNLGEHIRADIGMLVLIIFLFGGAVSTAQLANVQFAPDSMYYTAMAFHYTGLAQDDAREAILAASESEGWETPPVESLFGWGLVQPRVVYPALSAPFVLLFGTQGMLVVPILSMLFVVLAGYRAMLGRYGHGPTLAVTMLLVGSHFVFYWGTAMLTEGLAAAIGTGIFLTLPIWRESRKWDLLICTGLILAMAFTRQAAVIPAGAIVVAALGYTITSKKLWNRWTPFASWAMVTAIGSQLFQRRLWPTFSIRNHYFGRVAEADNLTDAVLAVPSVLKHIFTLDFAQYKMRDQALLLLIVVAAASFVVLWNKTEAHLLAGAVAATLLINVLNGTPTSFRYAMPGLIFYLVAAAAVIALAVPTTSHASEPMLSLTAPDT